MPRPVTVARPRIALPIQQSLERAARITLVAGLFVVPVVFDPRSVDAFNLAKITALWSFAVVAAGLLLASALIVRSEPVVRRSRVVRIAFVLLAVTVVGTALSTSRTLSVFGLYHRYGGLVSLAIYVAVAALIVSLYSRRHDALVEIAVAVAAAAVVVSVYVVLQRAGVDPFHWRLGAGNSPASPIGNLGNSDFSAAYLAIAAPLVAYLAINGRSMLARGGWALAGALALAALLLTGSRTGLLAVIGGLAAVVLFASGVRGVRKLVVVGVMLAGLSFVPLLAGRLSSSAGTSFFASDSVRHRTQESAVAVRMVMRRPVLGWGPESYFGTYPRFRSASDAVERGLIISDKPHNIYLEWATSTGITGAIVYLILVGAALWLVADRAPRLPRGPGLLAAAFGGALVAYLVQGLFSIDVPPLAVTGWVAVAALAALLETKAPRDEPGAEAADAQLMRVRSRRWLAAAAVPLLVAIGLVVAGLGPLRADHAAWAADRRSGGWSDEAVRLHDKAIRLNSREAAYLSLAGTYLERVAGVSGTPISEVAALERAASLYERAAKIQPHNLYFMLDAVRVYGRLGRTGGGVYFSLADDWMTRAVALDRLDPQVRDIHVRILTQWAAVTKDKATRSALVARAADEARIAAGLRDGHPVRS